MIYIPLCFYLYVLHIQHRIYRNNLHSTMFLLIRSTDLMEKNRIQNLHSTMFLLIHHQPVQGAWMHIHLHSTMFLLIRYVPGKEPSAGIQFTFHYVSTYTMSGVPNIKMLKEFTFHYVSTYTRSGIHILLECTNLHSTMFLLILVHFPPLIHTVSRPPNCRPLYFLPHPPLFFLLIFLLSSILLQKYALCRLPIFSALSQVDNHRKLLVLSSWMPQNSFGIHFSFLHLKIIKESLSSRMTLFNSIFNFRSCDSDISPSKTEF